LSWKPLHEKHSIERVRIEIRFQDALPPKLVTTIGEKSDQRMVALGFGPRSSRSTTRIDLSVSADGQPTPKTEQAVVGWQCVRLGFDGAPLEALVPEPGGLVYETTEYSRWTVLLERVELVARDVLTQVDAMTAVSLLLLDYSDRFFFDGQTDSASPIGAVRSEIAETFPPEVQSGKEMWHLYRGWFTGEGKERLLMIQNLDIQVGETKTGADMRSLQVFTRTEKREAFSGLEADQLHSDLAVMHSSCKAAFKWVLSDALRDKVGLT
jgi:uncharacterized protein (TIGR04255 family)